MISIEEFYEIVNSFRNVTNNQAQKDAIEFNEDKILQIVAGPGTGKTTVLVLRALKYLFVDGFLPEQILLTTFTKKAAKELRSRWLEWGNKIVKILISNPVRYHLRNNIDLNRCKIDTLDSIIQQTLTDFKEIGQSAPIVLEESASKIFLKKEAFRNIYQSNKVILNTFLSDFAFDHSAPMTQGNALIITKNVCERFYHDLVDIISFKQHCNENYLIGEIFEKYHDRLEQSNLFDFSKLQKYFLKRLHNNTLEDWLENIKIMLIDEYQDTNPLQEKIYFTILSKANPITTIVGDDDQAMYRFRGSSVELFTNFANRCQVDTGKSTKRIDLTKNYRSTPEIIDFYNRHIANDTQFQSARILPPKQSITHFRNSGNFPILGMFRESKEELAKSLSGWLCELFNQKRIYIRGIDKTINLIDYNNFCDCVLLSHTVREIRFDQHNKREENRFISNFRNACSNKGINIFNPRGKTLRHIKSVQILLGLLLKCLDPDDKIHNVYHCTDEVKYFFRKWRNEASEFIIKNPVPNGNHGISRFIDDWGKVYGIYKQKWPDDWPVLEIIFRLICWMPEFQQDPEHQVYLEAITRIISSSSLVSSYKMQVINHKNIDDNIRSRNEIIINALIPIAADEVQIDEDIMPSIPRNYLQVMTIHQSKGLEFPLVIVDVGSHFRVNNWRQAFLRYPREASNTANLEDTVEYYLPSQLRGSRTGIDRTFDDLIRLYYVAYSRPQSILMLIGHENNLTYGRGKTFTTGTIPNIATGWDRSKKWSWRQSVKQGSKPPVYVSPPFINFI